MTPSIPDSAIEGLRSLLERARHPELGPDEAKVAKIIAARNSVLARFGPVFAPNAVGQIAPAVFLDFLDFRSNRHWHGLDRHGQSLISDLERLRQALSILVDESRPIEERLDEIRPPAGKPMVRNMGKALITAILHVTYPERYGVLNNITKNGLQSLGLWPRHLSNAPFSEVYGRINPILQSLAAKLDTDLWTLDALWWLMALEQKGTASAPIAHAGFAGSSSNPLPPTLRVFVNDDAGYLDWLVAHPNGYVVNSQRNPVPNYLVLHRANCTWINPPRFTVWTTGNYIKICADTIPELSSWAMTQVGGSLQPCKVCRPTPSQPLSVPTQAPSTSPTPLPFVDETPSAAPGVEANLKLPSGLTFSSDQVLQRLLRFCREEYPYYDGIVDLDPDHVTPVDVLATISVNSFVRDATRVRTVHRGLASQCDSILARIPSGADLLAYDFSLQAFEQLIHAAVQAPGVLVAVATKVLHRKRRDFIPMLDSVVMGHYLRAANHPEWIELGQQKAQAARVAVEAVRGFREDLWRCAAELSDLQSHLAGDGFPLSKVRILEILIWTATEPNGYYRS